MFKKDSSVSFVSFEEVSEPLGIKTSIVSHYSFGDYYNTIKEIEEREESKMISFNTKDLSSLPVSFNDETKMRIEGNKIVHCGSSACETCLIGPHLMNGVYRITFEICCKTNSFGIIDGSLQYMKSDLSISERHIGCEFGNLSRNVLDLSMMMMIIVFIVLNVFTISSNITGNSRNMDLLFNFRMKINMDFNTWLSIGCCILLIVILIIYLLLAFQYLKNLVDIYDKEHKKICEIKGLEIGDCFAMEVDLRSNESEKRTLHFFVNNSQEKVFFYGLPDSIQFGVCFFYTYSYIIIIIAINIYIFMFFLIVFK